VRSFIAWGAVFLILGVAVAHATLVRRHNPQPSRASLASAPAGTLTEVCRSPSLGGSILSLVYLPSGYGTSSTRYPVIYVLHGLPAGPQTYTGSGFVAAAVATGSRPAIVVTPQGALSQNSDPEYLDRGRTEDWPRAIGHDLTRCIDARFRTIAKRWGRALVGFSAGGFGAMNIGLRNLATYGAVESWSGYFEATDPSGEYLTAWHTATKDVQAWLAGKKDTDLAKALPDLPRMPDPIRTVTESLGGGRSVILVDDRDKARLSRLLGRYRNRDGGLAGAPKLLLALADTDLLHGEYTGIVHAKGGNTVRKVGKLHAWRINALLAASRGLSLMELCAAHSPQLHDLCTDLYDPGAYEFQPAVVRQFDAFDAETYPVYARARVAGARALHSQLTREQSRPRRPRRHRRPLA